MTAVKSEKKARRALISVSDKTNLIPLARVLRKFHIEILSTGGTLKALKEAGIAARAVEDVTGFPEILEGRVKTLHPKIHGGLLFRRDKKSHVQEARQHDIAAIDFVIVNLYPFEKVTCEKSCDLETAVENIDIGGPSMLRSAAKNFDSVTVVCDPEDYPEVIRDLEAQRGKISPALRKKLAVKVFARTAAYDRAISDFFTSRNGTAAGKEPAKHRAENPLPENLELSFRKVCDLRYGENPHQRAAYYVPASAGGKTPFRQLHGKELSYNNLLDIDGALQAIMEFDRPAACVVKHSNPCGVAEDKDPARALELAIECDLMSAFGGILAVNRPCDLRLAEMAYDKLKFFEVFIAPEFDAKALPFLTARKNVRLIEAGISARPETPDYRFIQHGLLVQDRDLPLKLHAAELDKTAHFVTETKLPGSEWEALLFAFKCVKTVKSNAIVITQGFQTVGIGAGQMSRVDAVEIACSKAGYRTEGGYLASDAFFPMPDSIEAAHKAKIKAIIQPGGSIRDGDVIAACDRYGIAMAFTGERHFRH